MLLHLGTKSSPANVELFFFSLTIILSGFLAPVSNFMLIYSQRFGLFGVTISIHSFLMLHLFSSRMLLFVVGLRLESTLQICPMLASTLPTMLSATS